MAFDRSFIRNANVSITIKRLWQQFLDAYDAAAATVNSITGTDSSLGINGQAAAQGGAVALTGGTSSTSANAGGAITETGGTPGATGAGGAVTLTGGVGGTTSGAGGAVSIAGGAGTAGNSKGGAVSIAPGASQGSALKSHVNVGIAGTVVFYPQAAPKADAGDAAQTITVAEMLAGIVSATPTTGRAVTTPTGTEMDAGFNVADIPANFGFDFSVQNRTAFAATDDILTLTAGASGMTITGSAVVSPGSTARFRAVRTATNTWICYKLAG